jgi:hypothetical protein
MLKNILAVALFVTLFCSIGLAQGPRLTPAQRKLALRVARVAAHEGALHNLADVDLVWQVTESRAKTTEKRSEFLAMHSGRAIGVKPCTGLTKNCEWSPLLDHKGTIPASVAIGDEGYWRTIAIPAWQRVLARAEELVAGEPYVKPCRLDPYTWGSVKLDSKRAAADGLYPIGCTGTLNDGFTFKAALVVR